MNRVVFHGLPIPRAPLRAPHIVACDLAVAAADVELLEHDVVGQHGVLLSAEGERQVETAAGERRGGNDM
eukprot:5300833-Pyramimonas_sp.AAC.1